MDEPRLSIQGRRRLVRSLRLGPYLFKQARTDDEFEQLHRLNYRTFVREIPQHQDTGTGCLIDKFHGKNTYYVSVRDRCVVGMITVHDCQPFSVAEKMEDPAVLEGLGNRLIEARLLAIEPGQRHSLVFGGLNWMMLQHAMNGGYSHILISGYLDRQSLYERAGFRPLGPSVRSGDAAFIPMVMSLNDLPDGALRRLNRWRSRVKRAEKAPPIGLLPGPVTLAPQVARALGRRAISHRGGRGIRLYERVRQRLRSMVGGVDAALFCGSGTLANDVVAWSLAAHEKQGRGLVLVNGEFGERLAGQAARAGLQFESIQWPWGWPWDLDQVADKLQSGQGPDWVWAVHLESSTGMLNDMRALSALGARLGVRVCIDCVSSVGAVPVDLQDIYLATGSSGKALGSVAGISMVFASPEALRCVQADRVPAYMDLVGSMRTEGTRFTCPMGPLEALGAALEAYADDDRCAVRFEQYEKLGRHVRERLAEAGIEALVGPPHACPVLTTFEPPHEESSCRFVSRCRRWGYEVGGMSNYLQARRWAQIATMGQMSIDVIRPLFDHLARWSQTGADSVSAAR